MAKKNATPKSILLQSSTHPPHLIQKLMQAAILPALLATGGLRLQKFARAEEGKESAGIREESWRLAAFQQAAPPTGATTAASATTEDELARVESALGGAREPTRAALVKALGIYEVKTSEEFDDSPGSSLLEMENLDEGSAPVFALKWLGPPGVKSGEETTGDSSAAPSWAIFLLAWDGAHWNASWMKEGFEPFDLQVVPGVDPGARQIALVIYSGSASIPYPAIYALQNHAASLLWDGRPDASQYEGYAHGKIEFRATGAGAPEMTETGRADPGVIRFPKGGRRGFDVRSEYVWNGKGYVPKSTEYSADRDFTLYQFIAALHLKDFRTAYALIDPVKFLNNTSPSLKIFRQHIENALPEFLDDEIFEVPDSPPGVPGDFSFQVEHKGKIFIYHPQFTPGPKYRITGLARQEETIPKD